MRSHNLFRLAQGALLASLLLITACDRSFPVGPGDEAVIFRFEQASVSENVLSNTTTATGTFTTTGAVVDQGSYEEALAIGGTHGGPWRIYGYRSLEGARGTLVMQYTGLVREGEQQGRVQVTIQRGTGAYASLVGSDAFEIELVSGVPVLQPMIQFTAQLSQE